MATGRFPLFATLLLAGSWLPALAGCTSPGPIASRRNTMGMLKSSVSQLEASNQDLKKQVASLRSESSRFENELAQERQENGELMARLDDARQVIKKNGGDVTAFNSPATRASTAAHDSDEIPAPVRPSQVRRSSRGTRRPPAASIPAPEPSTSATVVPGRGTSSSSDVDPGPQASREDFDDARWLPITRGPRGRGGAVVIR